MTICNVVAQWLLLFVLLRAADARWFQHTATGWKPSAMCHDYPGKKLGAIEEHWLHMVEMGVTGSLMDETGRCGDWGSCDDSKAVPYDVQLRKGGEDWPVVGHTMVGHKRLQNVRSVLADAIDKGVPGDFAELGVWRGGACIYAKAVLVAYGEPQRRVHVFDAFEAMNSYATGGNSMASFLNTSVAMVKHNFAKYNLLDDTVKFHKGLFKTTVPAFRSANPTAQLAVLRIDSNFYDSYQDALYYLYELVPVGGYVIFDDVMSHPPVMEAWLDFQRDQGLPEGLTRIDHHSAYFRKEKEVKLDLSHMKAPRDANV